MLLQTKKVQNEFSELSSVEKNGKYVLYKTMFTFLSSQNCWQNTILKTNSNFLLNTHTHTQAASFYQQYYLHLPLPLPFTSVNVSIPLPFPFFYLSLSPSPLSSLHCPYNSLQLTLSFKVAKFCFFFRQLNYFFPPLLHLSYLIPPSFIFFIGFIHFEQKSYISWIIHSGGSKPIVSWSELFGSKVQISRVTEVLFNVVYFNVTSSIVLCNINK